MGKSIDRIKNVTVDEILAGARLGIPFALDVFKKAPGVAKKQVELK
jgi:hypothetical protein